jgi:hypothetical protein
LDDHDVTDYTAQRKRKLRWIPLAVLAAVLCGPFLVDLAWCMSAFVATSTE